MADGAGEREAKSQDKQRGYAPERDSHRRVMRVIERSRFGIVLAIAGVAIGSMAILIYSLIVLVKSIFHAFFETSFDMEGAKGLAVELIEMTDFFLLGMVLYVVSFGMFQLFINENVNVPEWMRVTSLDQLKIQIVNVIVVLLAVTFLATAITWSGGDEILFFAGAVSAVIVAISLFVLIHARTTKH